MGSVGWSTLDIIPSVKGLRAELEKQTSGDLKAAGKKGGKRYGDAAGTAAAAGFKSKIGNGFKDFARDITPLGGAAIGAGLVLGLKTIVSTASEAQQAVGGVQAVFKEYANEVIADSKNAAQGLGLSAAAYQQLVTVSGALLKNKGLKDYADQASNLVEIGADLSAMFGGSTLDAVSALNAALRGESDPIERYAISLGETAVNAELAAAGQANLTGSALEMAKTQARLSLIIKQSADAQGAFAREADTAAGAAARLSAGLQDRLAKAGDVALDSVAALANGLNNEVLPALDAAGGFAADSVRAFNDLPGPVKAAAAAFAALRVSTALGVTGGVSSGFASMRSGLDTLRLRAMLATDEFRNLRTASLNINQTSQVFTPAVGRMSASLGALRAGAAGAGSALRRGLSGAMGLLGGPWGIALAGGAAALVHFQGKQREAKAHVDGLTASLDAQTGAITDNTREQIINKLEAEGVLKAADQFGLSLSRVTDAALGNEGAMRLVNEQLQRHIDAMPGVVAGDSAGAQAMQNTLDAADRLRGALEGETGALAESRRQVDRKRRADGLGAKATDQLAGATKTYTTSLDNARAAVQKLLDKENERRDRNRANRRDLLGLQQSLIDAREELKEGPRVLGTGTQAAIDNESALLDLADQWANSSAAARRAFGGYDQIRRIMVDLADQMNGPKGTRRSAELLVDELLKVPKGKEIKITTPGMKEALAAIKEMQRQFRIARELAAIRVTLPGGPRPPATGGDGGFGGSPSGDSERSVTNSNVTNIGTVVAHDYDDFLQQAERRRRASALDGISR